MFFFSVFTKVSRIVCFIPENFCLSRFRICDNLFSFNEIFTGQTLNQDWGLQWLTGVTLLIFILMLETYKTVKEVNYVIIKMLMKYFSGSCNCISLANSPCHNWRGGGQTRAYNLHNFNFNENVWNKLSSAKIGSKWLKL